MKPVVPILTTILLFTGFVGCGDDSATTSRKAAELAVEVRRESDAIDVRNQQLELQIVELSQGRVAADTLGFCYLSGYPKAPDKGLSRRKIAECDAILKAQARIDARQAAQEKRKDAEYDNNHPK